MPADFVSEFRRGQAYDAGKKAALEGMPRSSCNRTRGTIYYDDWNDGFSDGERNLERNRP